MMVRRGRLAPVTRRSQAKPTSSPPSHLHHNCINFIISRINLYIKLTIDTRTVPVCRTNVRQRPTLGLSLQDHDGDTRSSHQAQPGAAHFLTTLPSFPVTLHHNCSYHQPHQLVHQTSPPGHHRLPCVQKIPYMLFRPTPGLSHRDMHLR